MVSCLCSGSLPLLLSLSWSVVFVLAHCLFCFLCRGQLSLFWLIASSAFSVVVSCLCSGSLPLLLSLSWSVVFVLAHCLFCFLCRGQLSLFSLIASSAFSVVVITLSSSSSLFPWFFSSSITVINHRCHRHVCSASIVFFSSSPLLLPRLRLLVSVTAWRVLWRKGTASAAGPPAQMICVPRQFNTACDVCPAGASMFVWTCPSRCLQFVFAGFFFSSLFFLFFPASAPSLYFVSVALSGQVACRIGRNSGFFFLLFFLSFFLF